MLVCANVASHTEKLQIALSEIEPLSWRAIRYVLGRIRNTVEDNAVGEEEQIR